MVNIYINVLLVHIMIISISQQCQVIFSVHLVWSTSLTNDRSTWGSWTTKTKWKHHKNKSKWKYKIPAHLIGSLWNSMCISVTRLQRCVANFTMIRALYMSIYIKEHQSRFDTWQPFWSDTRPWLSRDKLYDKLYKQGLISLMFMSSLSNSHQKLIYSLHEI